MQRKKLKSKYKAIWAKQNRKTLVRKAIVYSIWTMAGFYLLFQLLARVGFFGEVPATEDLKSFENHNSSKVYAAGGEILGKYFIYDRTAVTLEELSPWIVPALISTEDARFYRHNGTDYFSLGRVLIKNILLGQRSAGGGSTITRQLAKNLYPRQRRGFIWLVGEKIREGIIASRLERVYSKDEILTLYLNTVPFGENIFGISAASQRFFNKHPGQLDIEEVATLIGALKATTAFNPRINPEASQARRNVVIGQLERYGHITPEKADSLQSLPLVIDYNLLSHGHGPATYFREMLRQELKEILDDYNKRNGTDLNLYTSGLQIYTTIDYHLQMIAERAYSRQMRALQNSVDEHFRNTRMSAVRPLLRQLARNSDRYESLRHEGKSDAQAMENFNQPSNILFFDWDGEKNLNKSPMDSIFSSQKVLHGGLVSINPRNGHVLAWVGGNNIRFFQFDNVLSQRQTGSAFKPFVYAAALEAGLNPCQLTTNERPVFANYDNWSPENHDGNYEGYYSMQGALTHSVNTVSARYIEFTGVEPVINLARAAGIRGKLPEFPSLSLGTAETSLLDLTAAFAIFLNNGQPLKPFYLLRIEDAGGNIIFRGRNIQSDEPVIHPETSLIMTHMLKSVVNSGTAVSIRNFVGYEYDLAGKTGTTQNNSDSWFIGFTSNLITGIWVGLENPAFNSVFPLPFGASGSAVPIWGDYHAGILRHGRTREYITGFLPSPDYELYDFLNCPMFQSELQQPGLFERIMGQPENRTIDLDDSGREIQRKNRIRELIENAFRKRPNN
ncbi:MAG TPA: transglycosylase domain-containing protein [Bacteroidales bacterium]|nr:transglycosylase domain-containing protein [Bacteroidales bacterium]